ncbi:E3 ubiquitin-protein ligase SspH2 [Pandoraea horticolens]|uniref:E3 ubiquitin-protein ligase SspH2 n=2 Tax=Pandoraea horticolens TaxID=2508298 RepID=A0A5E4Z3K2_9BURK|nr:E3 ubiquitin-protein ligase SspH2 [Pandoraea horticolens]
MPITPTSSHSLAAPARPLSTLSFPSQQVNEAQRLALEYVGQGDDPGHERRCTALLAALAWAHRQFSQTGGDDMESVHWNLTQHLARSCREGIDAEALAETLASLCVVSAHGSQSPDPSPVHVQLARDVLATLDTRVDAHELLCELLGSLSERRGGHDNGIDELYRSALCAWVAIAPLEWGGKGERAIARDRILNMADGKLDLLGLGLGHLPELPAGLTRLDVSGNQLPHLPELPASLTVLYASDNRLTELPELPAGLTMLDVSGNQLPHLPELPTSLTELNVRRNQLSRLPVLPAGLTALGAGFNQLTQLPALPAGLTMLSVSGNQLPHLPELPASLTALYASDNHLTELPELPAGLKLFSVGDNQLTALPTLPANLMDLCVYGNHLTELPALPASLGRLDTRNNQLTRLPPSVLSLPYSGQVFVDNNPFSPAYLQRLRAALSAPGYSGPRIHFSMATAGVSIAATRPLPDAVRDWFTNDEQAQMSQWRMHGEEAHAAEFSRFLDRLRESVNYNADFKKAVASWLSRLAQDGELRQLAFQVVQGATESCEDRVALTYNTLTKLSHAHAVTRGECDARLDEIVDRGRGAFRLDALEKIARQKAQTLSLVDEIEVYLAYQVQLRDRLELPTDIANMRFFHVAGVAPNDLMDAEQEVRARESTEFAQYFLVEWAPWQQVLARLDPEGTERAHQKLQDMLLGYEQEVAAQLASISLPKDHDAQAQAGVGIMKAQQLEVYKELSREFLCKRGEEVLMDRIMGAGNR